MESTLKYKLETHSGVLPQLRTLEVSVDVSGKVKPGAMETGPALPDQAGFQHGRGERPSKQGPSPSVQAEESRGVTRVFVLSEQGKALMPCHAARARELVRKGRAGVVRRYPFVIRLKNNPHQPGSQPVAIKLDPGAKTTGIALVRLTSSAHIVLHLSELTHRGATIRENLDQRRAFRRNRRGRKMWYRAPRFNNRIRAEGWLAPSLQSRVDNVISWVRRYRRWAPITSIVVETVRFDTQKLINPEISGVEYQQGTLFCYELREYLLEKFERACVYCGRTSVPLEIDHVHPRSRGGATNAKNLVVACHGCNQAKGNQPVEDFLAGEPERLKRIKSRLQTPLKETAAVNATRAKILSELFKTQLPVEITTGGRTKFNRARLSIPKAHALDAACTGDTPALTGWNMPVLAIKACGRGSYQRTRLDRYGFPRGYLLRQKGVKGFRTGDIVRVSATKGKKAGIYTGRLAIRASGSFNIQTAQTTIQGIGHKHCHLIQQADGYHYSLQEQPIPATAKSGEFP
jgi:5-methylcytosine-specific restriction endonuclease McrA